MAKEGTGIMRGNKAIKRTATLGNRPGAGENRDVVEESGWGGGSRAQNLVYQK